MTQHERRTLWADRVAAQQASGASAVAWCFQQGISEQSFYAWRKRLTAAPASSGPQWAAVTPEVGAGVTLRVGRVAIEVTPGFDPHVLTAVLAALEGR
jgi:hypothetical protein